MTFKQAIDTIAKYQYKHKELQDAHTADIVQAFKRLFASKDMNDIVLAEALQGIAILLPLILELRKFMVGFKGPYLKDHESL